MSLTSIDNMHLHIRDAKGSDIEAINDIYNYYVLNSTCTAQTEPESREGRERWLQEHTGRYAAIVAEADGQVVGWGSLSKYHQRYAYWPTSEDSIYVKHDLLHRGIGKMLLEALIKQGDGRTASTVSWGSYPQNRWPASGCTPFSASRRSVTCGRWS